MKKPKPCITLWLNTPDIWEHSKNVENIYKIAFTLLENVMKSATNTKIDILFQFYCRNQKGTTCYNMYLLIHIFHTSQF